MIAVVFDCGVLISAIGWQGNPRHCLSLVAHRQIRLCATTAVWEEYETRLIEVLAQKQPSLDPRPTLDWLLTVALFVEPALLGKQRSRDLKDDRYLACALAARAEFLVSNDRDLLDMGKPFGIQVVTPLELLLRVRGRSGF